MVVKPSASSEWFEIENVIGQGIHLRCDHLVCLFTREPTYRLTQAFAACRVALGAPAIWLEREAVLKNELDAIPANDCAPPVPNREQDAAISVVA